MTRNLTLSAQQVDPLSWFLGPAVPVTFSTVAALLGLIQAGMLWAELSRPWLQLIAIACFVAGGLIVQLAARPLRPPLGSGNAAFALGFAVLGFLASAWGLVDVPLRPELWWAPIALGLAIGSLAPYLSVQRMLWLGGGATFVALLGCVLLQPSFVARSEFAELLLVAFAPMLAMVGTAVFSWSIVNATVPMLDDPTRFVVPGRALGEEAERAERERLERLTARAVPLLTSIAHARRVTAHDRVLAGQVARQLRHELVANVGSGWLDPRIRVVDPHSLASRLGVTQRIALREFLRAALEHPATTPGSVLLEFRRAPDGATGVAVTLSRALPEGSSVLYLAPHYLTLGATVDALTLRGRRLSFRVPR